MTHKGCRVVKPQHNQKSPLYNIASDVQSQLYVHSHHVNIFSGKESYCFLKGSTQKGREFSSLGSKCFPF